MSALGAALRRPATWPRRRPPVDRQRRIDAAARLNRESRHAVHPAVRDLASRKLAEMRAAERDEALDEILAELEP